MTRIDVICNKLFVFYLVVKTNNIIADSCNQTAKLFKNEIKIKKNA